MSGIGTFLYLQISELFKYLKKNKFRPLIQVIYCNQSQFVRFNPSPQSHHTVFIKLTYCTICGFSGLDLLRKLMGLNLGQWLLSSKQCYSIPRPNPPSITQDAQERVWRHSLRRGRVTHWEWDTGPSCYTENWINKTKFRCYTAYCKNKKV